MVAIITLLSQCFPGGEGMRLRFFGEVSSQLDKGNRYTSRIKHYCVTHVVHPTVGTNPNISGGVRETSSWTDWGPSLAQFPKYLQVQESSLLGSSSLFTSPKLAKPVCKDKLLLVGALMPARGGAAAVILQGSAPHGRDRGHPPFSRDEPGGQTSPTSQGLQPALSFLWVGSVIVFSPPSPFLI